MGRSGGSTAFVLGGGGVLGATQVGMLRALLERDVRPDLIVGTSVGALNGAIVASDPSPASVATLDRLWSSMSEQGVFADSMLVRAARLTRERTHLHSSAPLRTMLAAQLPVTEFDQLPVRFECVAASIERATAHWFNTGPIIDAVIASCAVPGLFAPAVVGGEHFYDGGLVHSIPIGRALALGATRIFVIHVGRVEQVLRPPRWPWEVGLVAFEIARRHRFVEELAQVPDSVDIHVLPSGEADTPLVSVRYRDARHAATRMQRAYEASAGYLSRISATR
ncbi:MAG: patatin-like phospholipase family protein [Jatrophihabitantaceae bacterium]